MKQPVAPVHSCPAHNEPALGYLQWHYDAERRGKAGERQRKCLLCGLWIWEEHYTDFEAMGDTEMMEKKRERVARMEIKRAAAKR
jgi:hypothetical protein